MTTKEMAILTVTDSSTGRQILPLLRDVVTVGRASSNTIVNTDSRTSQNHALIRRQNNVFLLEDQGSTNGTWVNGREVITPVDLKNGDVILIGSTEYQFQRLAEIDDILEALLYQIPLFDNLSEASWRKMITEAQYEHMLAGQTLSLANHEEELLIVLLGEVSLSDKSGTVADQTLTAGRFLDGEYGQQILNVTEITAVTDAWLMILNREKVNRLLIPFLQTLSFFEDVSEPQLQEIAQRTNLRFATADTVLFQQGEPADALYIVIYGTVVVLKETEQNGVVLRDEIRKYGRGALFGELGLLVEQDRAATGLVKEPTGLLILSKQKFQTLVNEYPNIVLNLYQYIAELLEEQSIAFWQAAQDIEKMKGLIQQTKMAALGQLVAGVAHEINTPVGSIHANSRQLQDILAETQEEMAQLMQIVETLNDPGILRETAVAAGVTLDEQTLAIVQAIVEQQQQTLQDFYQNSDLEFNLGDLNAIAGELANASDRITVMVKNLGNFTRLDEAERKTVDLHEGLDATLSLLHHELKYKVVVEKDYGHLPKITCNPNQINQVFMNIIMNGIQAMDLDKLGRDEKGHIHIKTYREGRWAVVAITDTGKGITDAEMQKIFEPFYSTKGAAAAAGGLGLGLGLSISLKIVQEQHGGKIEVASKLGQGTTFYIKLPLDNPTETAVSKTMIGMKRPF